MVYLELYSPVFKKPAGAAKTRESICFEISAPEKDHLYLTCRSDDGDNEFEITMNKSDGVHRCCVQFEHEGLYFFSITDSESAFLNCTKEGQLFFSRSQTWIQQLVVSSSYDPASSFYGGIAYQIFPDRFAISGEVIRIPGRVYHDDLSEIPVWRPDEKGKVRNNDFYGGNLKGIEEKLGYLSELGVSLIYLNPIFESNSNHRYDTGDYMHIDRQLGTEQDFRDLCSSASRLGIRIILDGVFSHTGDDSIYFNKYGHYDSLGAYQSMDSEYYRWFSFKRWPDRYNSWWGIDTLPEVNESEPSYTEFITGKGGVIDHWMQAGASGFRLDVADELPDEFIREIRKAIRRNDPDGLLIGEVWEDASNKISYGRRRKYFWGDELDGCMNYPFKKAVLEYIRTADAASFGEAIEEICIHYPPEMLLSCLNMLSSHDTERAINALAAPEGAHKSRGEQAERILSKDEYLRGVEMVKLAYAVMFFLPGIPMIYYGDEIGMQGYGDPFCRGFYCEDLADENLRSAISIICAKRKENADILDTGATDIFLAEEGVVGFYRIKEEKKLAFIINMGERTVSVLGRDIEPWKYEIIRF